MNTSEFKFLTLEFVKELCAEIGISCNSRPATGEYRVNHQIGGTEGTAYYVTDLADALGTAVAMHRNHDPIRRPADVCARLAIYS